MGMAETVWLELTPVFPVPGLFSFPFFPPFFSIFFFSVRGTTPVYTRLPWLSPPSEKRAEGFTRHLRSIMFLIVR